MSVFFRMVGRPLDNNGISVHEFLPANTRADPGFLVVADLYSFFYLNGGPAVFPPRRFFFSLPLEDILLVSIFIYPMVLSLYLIFFLIPSAELFDSPPPPHRRRFFFFRFGGRNLFRPALFPFISTPHPQTPPHNHSFPRLRSLRDGPPRAFRRRSGVSFPKLFF